MKKKKKKDKGLTNLIDMDVHELSFVDKGANDKVFHLFKRKVDTMNKELAIKLLKAAGLSEDEKEEILEQVDESDRKEVEEAVSGSMEKAGAKFNKDVLSKLESIAKLIQAVLGKQKEEDEDEIPGKKKKKTVEKTDEVEFSDEDLTKMLEDEVTGKNAEDLTPAQILANAFQKAIDSKK